MSTNTEDLSYTKIKRLSDEKLEELWIEYLSNPSNKKLRDELIVQYIYLTRYVVSRMKSCIPSGFSLEDITAYGVEGLIKAIERFSADRGAKFETYAIMRIRGNIIDKIRAQDFLPRTQRRKIKQIKEVAENLKQKLGREATTREISEVVGIEPDKILSILADDTSVTSLYDKKGSSDDSVAIIDTIEDKNNENPLEVLEKKDAKKELQEALKRLPERERMILVLYYHENMTLKEIGSYMEISESRVCQIHSQAIMRLRNSLTTNKSTRLKKSII